MQRVASSGVLVEPEAAVDSNQGKCNMPKCAGPGPSLQPSAGSLILGSCTTSHPYSRLPGHTSNVLLPINKQIRSAVITFVSNGPVLGSVFFAGINSTPPILLLVKMYTCLMITHMSDENNDLGMFNVFFNEPVLCPVGVGAGYLSIRLMQRPETCTESPVGFD